MTYKHIAIGLIFGSMLLIGGIPVVNAEESSSFRLYHSVSNDAQKGPAVSDSFNMNEDGITVNVMPITSGSFQIVTAPPLVIEEDGGDGGGDDTDDTLGGGGGESGGRRGGGTTTTNPPAPTTPSGDGPTPPSSDDDGRPAAPSEPAVEPPKKPALPSYEPPSDEVDFRLPSTDYISKLLLPLRRGEEVFAPLHYFRIIDSKDMVRMVPYKQGIEPSEIIRIIEEVHKYQIAVVTTQAIAALSFLTAFKLLLNKVPQSILSSMRIGGLSSSRAIAARATRNTAVRRRKRSKHKASNRKKK
ncbi:hypothetical protein KJ652_05585 [Patescibacteria group bacterium]|nr:hypothetical protein [Patescibacteria group bacterium]MBU1124033.1 hypothetical protein [Patescibacteria group bacterium]MBU1911244.1 hypothetical protein [Patescibacteria group bacterium]